MPVTSSDDVFDGLKIFIEGIDVEIGRNIGEGGQGLVKKAKLIPSGETVAVKHYKYNCYYDESITSEVRHLKAAAGYKGIIKLRGVYQKTDSPRARKSLVLEFCEGGSLDQAIDRKELYYECYKEVNWIVQIVEAVRHLHAHGIMHRDLKPANILFTSSARECIKICDFAECITLSHETDVVKNSSERGTPGFRATEIEAQKNYNNSADIYSLGITIVCILLETSPEQLGVVKFKDMCLSAEIDVKEYRHALAIAEKKNFFNDPNKSTGLHFGVILDLISLAVKMCSSDAADRPTTDEVSVRVRNVLAKYHYTTNGTYIQQGKPQVREVSGQVEEVLEELVDRPTRQPHNFKTSCVKQECEKSKFNLVEKGEHIGQDQLWEMIRQQEMYIMYIKQEVQKMQKRRKITWVFLEEQEKLKYNLVEKSEYIGQNQLWKLIRQQEMYIKQEKQEIKRERCRIRQLESQIEQEKQETKQARHYIKQLEIQIEQREEEIFTFHRSARGLPLSDSSKIDAKKAIMAYFIRCLSRKYIWNF